LVQTAHLVRALQHLPESAEAGKPAVQYYALDLDRAELVRTLEDLHRQEAAADGPDAAQWTVCGGKVGINGMHATYDQGAWTTSQSRREKLTLLQAWRTSALAACPATDRAACSGSARA
jgi:hypothetical protein